MNTVISPGYVTKCVHLLRLNSPSSATLRYNAADSSNWYTVQRQNDEEHRAEELLRGEIEGQRTKRGDNQRGRCNNPGGL